ncbi:AAA family ATPase [Geobacter sp. FeAm09]|uniref:sigma-54-dependent Fis family transcriptional regulator n=1 Tax=Geobacter sp. FeAm09 TaxID=2597769 RepID=UPI0011EC716F|nr:sigma 54-interacting transcriptional regulator [Geobacter sp. FeAm09]QEM67671.1 AAA family ATPase [Geobacter sp. FeAm09]
MGLVKKDDFFREVTIRIFSSLDTKTALACVFEYMSRYFPLDALTYAIPDANQKALRRIGRVGNEHSDMIDDFIPVSKQLMDMMQAFIRQNRKTFIASLAVPEEHMLLADPLFKLRNNSDISLPLFNGEKPLGWLHLRVAGKNKYNSSHVELLETVRQPFSIALYNALSHEIVLNNRDKLMDNNQFLSNELFQSSLDKIVGTSSGLKNVLEMVQQVAPLKNPVLILGETGTGKEMIANAIHFSSKVKNGPFIKINCGAIPENLIDSELFGHEKGAFTGAITEKKGRFERASGGTIFLDEIGELPPQAQVRLLRVLQYHEIERVGGTHPIKVDIRVIAATHRNLEQMVSENQFREDLWFRLNVFPIIIPPLRHRKEDIPDLARYFVEKKSASLNIKQPPPIAPGAIKRLLDYDWQGNIRELENLVERELIKYRGGALMFDSLPLNREIESVVTSHAIDGITSTLTIDEVVSLHIAKTLNMTKGKIHGPGGAAEILGINPNTLRTRMDKLGIEFGRKKRHWI